MGDFVSLPFVVFDGSFRGVLKPAARGSEDSRFDLFDLLRAEKLQEMGGLLSVTDPERVIKTSTDNIGVELAPVSVIHLSLEGISETVIRHAFQFSDGASVLFQSGYAVGMAKDLYPIDLNVKFFFFRAP